MDMSKTTVIVGLGSNLSPLKNLRSALGHLKSVRSFRRLKVSAIYESDAQVLPNAPIEWSKKYLNAAVLIEVNNFEPLQFLNELKMIEKKMGREHSERWAPREIDLDILYVDQFKFNSEYLTIPHKNLQERPFALLPALEVFPSLQLEKPIWANEWFSSERPFRTQKSKDLFWTQFVGILNLTTDSFSDGGQYLKEEQFKKQVDKLVRDGADILDLGAESTRPRANEVSDAVEFERLDLALGWLKEMNLNVQVSLDCRKPSVLKKLIGKFQIDFINDVTGFNDPSMLQILKNSTAKGVVMHSLTIPPDQKNTLLKDQNPCEQLMQWWNQKIIFFQNNEISIDRLIFDPGIGFGKTPEQNLYILNHLEEFKDVVVPTYLAFSRKSFLKNYISMEENHIKDLATAQQLGKINPLQYQYLRTHDIESQKIALRMLG
jgi:2-amino-4-hydroxy-6-hydroxymethyldihydropteridine diphosphokinase/dihydropteroate synthase